MTPQVSSSTRSVDVAAIGPDRALAGEQWSALRARMRSSSSALRARPWRTGRGSPEHLLGFISSRASSPCPADRSSKKARTSQAARPPVDGRRTCHAAGSRQRACAVTAIQRRAPQRRAGCGRYLRVAARHALARGWLPRPIRHQEMGAGGRSRRLHELTSQSAAGLRSFNRTLAAPKALSVREACAGSSPDPALCFG